MSKVYDALDEKLIGFIEAQKMFFVATAPLTGDGHVNMSPKGYDSFAILGPKKVAFCDLGGSGIETVAHVRENERITFMFCAFEGAAKILRLYGRGRIIQYEDPEYPEAMKPFAKFDRARAIIEVELTRIADACGWGVPFYDFKSERDQLTRYIENRSQEEWLESRYTRNETSIDGLPGLIRTDRAD